MDALEVIGLTVTIILVVLTIAAYLPQWHIIYIKKTSSGISLAAACLTALVAQGQMASLLFIWAHAKDFDDKPLHSEPSAMDKVNLAQAAVHWMSSIVTFILVCLYHPLTGDATEAEERSEAVYEVGRQRDRSVYLAVGILILHALLFLVALPFNAPAADALNMMIININNAFATPLWTGLSIVAVAAQLFKTSRHTEENCLSQTALLCQAMLYTLLAGLWPWRFQVPEYWMRCCGRGLEAVVTEWYPWVGWACVNCGVYALGQATLLVALQRKARGSVMLA